MPEHGDERLELEDTNVLRYCHGFTVRFGDGRVGRVTGILFDSVSGKPTALVVETGLFRRRRVKVPVANVTSVAPERRRVALSLTGKADIEEQGHVVRLSPIGQAGQR